VICTRPGVSPTLLPTVPIRRSARLDLLAVITFGDISLEAAARMYPLNYCTACSGADHDEQHPDLNYLA